MRTATTAEQSAVMMAPACCTCIALQTLVNVCPYTGADAIGRMLAISQELQVLGSCVLFVPYPQVALAWDAKSWALQPKHFSSQHV